MSVALLEMSKYNCLLEKRTNPIGSPTHYLLYLLQTASHGWQGVTHALAWLLNEFVFNRMLKKDKSWFFYPGS